MAKKEFKYRGMSLEEIQALSNKELAKILPSATRRKMNRGFTDQEKIFLKNLESSNKPVKTHCRDMVILPNMVGKTIKIHSGKEFTDLIILPEMIGHRFGEYVLSRKRAKHNDSAGKSKGAVSVR